MGSAFREPVSPTPEVMHLATPRWFKGDPECLCSAYGSSPKKGRRTCLQSQLNGYTMAFSSRIRPVVDRGQLSKFACLSRLCAAKSYSGLFARHRAG